MLKKLFIIFLLSFVPLSLSAQSQSQSELVFQIDTLEKYLNDIESNYQTQLIQIQNLEENLKKAEESLKTAEEQQQNLETQLQRVSAQQEELLNSLETSEKKLFYWKVGSVIVTTSLTATIVVLLVTR